MLESLYQDILMEHSHDPRNFGSLPTPDLKAEGYNPLCGDKVNICIQLDSQKQNNFEIKFTGEGCSICMASSSMMTEAVKGLSIQATQDLIADFRALLQSQKTVEEFKKLHPQEQCEDIESLAGVKQFPVRIKCALLPWTTLKEAYDSRSN